MYFVDNKPSTDFTPPIYDIDTEVKPNEIMSQVRNIRISGPVSFTNKENKNRATHEPIFAPDPMLSSTRLSDSLEENDHILADHNVTMPPVIQISINSSCESGSSMRKVTVDRASSKLSIPKVTITNINNNTIQKKNHDDFTKTNTAKKPIAAPKASKKRKADDSDGNTEPPKKKNASDVIVLDDTILDIDDDSVVFVSETVVSPMQHQLLVRSSSSSPSSISNFISINGNSSKQPSVSIFYIIFDNINIKYSLQNNENYFRWRFKSKIVFVNFIN